MGAVSTLDIVQQVRDALPRISPARKDYGTELEIVSGMEEDARVVVNPPDSLTSGMMVRVATDTESAPVR